jgi:hypothetical protein
VGDGRADSIVVNGTARDDTIQIMRFGNGTRVAVLGLAPRVNIAGVEGTNDHLTVNALSGKDTVDASDVPANLIGLTVNLGDGQGATATTTTLRTSTEVAVFGHRVLLTATVNSAAGTPAGIFTFLGGSVVLGMVPINAAGEGALMVSLGIGNHALTAVFGGDNGFAASTSTIITETVNQYAASTALSGSANPTFVDQIVSFTPASRRLRRGRACRPARSPCWTAAWSCSSDAKARSPRKAVPDRTR